MMYNNTHFQEDLNTFAKDPLVLSETERSDQTAQLLSNNEDDSLESRQPMMAMMPNNPMLMGSMSSQDANGGNGHNNYDFLADDCQNNQALSRERLQNFAEKLTFAFALKENLGEMSELESFLIEACRSQERIMSAISIERSAFRPCSTMKFTQSFGSVTLGTLQRDLKAQRASIMCVGEALQINTVEVCRLYQKETQRNNTLERQLRQAQKMLQQNQNEKHFEQETINEIEQRDHYIQELENQLTDARSQLLECKLTLTDREEQILSLNRQLSSLHSSYQELDVSKRELDDLIIKVSNQMRSRDYDIRDLNYQTHQEKQHLSLKCDVINRELVHEKDTRTRLEVLETDLLHRLQIKEKECLQLKQRSKDQEEKLQVQKEAIEKAQKVIEAMNAEMDRSAAVIKQVEDDRDKARREGKEQARRVTEIGKHMQNQIALEQQKQAQQSIQIKSEVDQLKEYLGQKQTEYEYERHHFQSQIDQANDQNAHLQHQIDLLQQNSSQEIAHMETQVADMKSQNQTLSDQVERLNKELDAKDEMFRQQYLSREEQTNGQIRYLQKRLKEVTQHADPMIPAPQVYQQGVTYLCSVKQEMASLMQDQVQLRSLIKHQCYDQSSQLVLKMKHFEDFRDRVLKALDCWDQKALDISNLAQGYYTELDENRRLFVCMRQIIKDKDTLINNLQRTLKGKDQMITVATIETRKEMERSVAGIKQDLIEQLRIAHVKIRQLMDEREDFDTRFTSFKQEFSVILDERERLKELNYRLNQEIEGQTQELIDIKKEHIDLLQRIRLLLGPSTTAGGQSELYLPNVGEILRDCELLIDELRIRRDESHSYKAQINQMHQTLDHERQITQQKLQSLETQLDLVQRQSLSKEEELQVHSLHQQTKHAQELTQLKREMDQMRTDLVHKERHQKKSHERLEQRDRKIRELDEKVASQERHMGEVQVQLGQIKREAEGYKEQVARMEGVVKAKEAEKEAVDKEMQGVQESWSQVNRQLMHKEGELQRERDLNLQLQDGKYLALTKYEAVRDRNVSLDKECEHLISELQMLNSKYNEAASQNDTLTSQNSTLQRKLTDLANLLTQAQNDLQTYEQQFQLLQSQVEQSKLTKLKMKDLKGTLRVMRSNETQLLETVARLQRRPMVSNADIQCDIDRPAKEELREIEQISRHNREENDELRDVLIRQGHDIERLIEEKRDLEDLVEQQNQSIKQIRQQQNSSIASIHSHFNTHMKENHNSLNKPQSQDHVSQQSIELMGKIVQEKENYIQKLETEMSEMRREIDNLREKLISVEINGCFDNKSMTGTTFPVSTTNNNMFGGSQHLRSQTLFQRTAQKFYNNKLMMSPSNYNGTLSTHFGTINMQNNLAPSNYNATILQSDNGGVRSSGAGSTIYGGGFTIQPPGSDTEALNQSPQMPNQFNQQQQYYNHRNSASNLRTIASTISALPQQYVR